MSQNKIDFGLVLPAGPKKNHLGPITFNSANNKSRNSGFELSISINNI